MLEEVKARETAVKTPRPKQEASKQDELKQDESKQEEMQEDKPENAEPDYLGVLSDVYEAATVAKSNADYPTGKKRKWTKKNPKTLLTPDYLGSDVSVRLDKTVAEGVYPRVSRGTEKDKTTEQLSALVKPYKGTPKLDAFLAGVCGEARTEMMDRKAYDDGVEARATALISDVVDYPGNSVIADRLLRQTRSAKDYVRLFTGTQKGEYSYGALPSQNRSTFLETSFERVDPFKNVGELVAKGTLTIGDVSALPTLRKLKSLIDADPTLVTVTAEGANQESAPVTPKAFSNYVAARAMSGRHRKKLAIAENQGQNIFSDAESDVEAEKGRLSVLSQTKLNAKLKELLRQWEILDRSIEALRALGADETGEMDVENPLIVEEEGEETAPKKKVAGKRPRKASKTVVDEQNLEVKTTGKKKGSGTRTRKKVKTSEEAPTVDTTAIDLTKVPKKRVYKKRGKKPANSADKL